MLHRAVLLLVLIAGASVAAHQQEQHLAHQQDGDPSQDVELLNALSPTLRIQSASAGIQSILDKLIPDIAKAVQGVTIPGESGKSDGFKWEIRSIKVNSFSIQRVTTEFPGYIHIKVANLNLAITASYKYKKRKFPWLPRGSGSATIDVRNGNADIGVNLGADRNGKPTASLKRASVTLGTVKVKVKSGLFSWLVNIILRLFRGTIKKAVQKGVNTAINAALGTALTNAVGRWRPERPVDAYASVFYGFEAVRYPGHKHFQLNLHAEFLNRANPADRYTGPRAQLPARTDDQHVEMFVDEFLLNSATYVYFKANRVRHIIDESTAPPGFPLPLRTEGWRRFLPQLPTTFPDQPMRIVVRAREAPTVHMTAARGAVATDLAEYVFQVPDPAPGKAWRNAFVLHANLNAGVRIWAKDDQRFHFELSQAGFQLTVASSNIGWIDLPVGTVSLIGDSILQYVVVPLVNEAVKDGFEMPTLPGFLWKRAKVEFEDRFLDIRGDLVYDSANGLLAPPTRRGGAAGGRSALHFHKKDDADSGNADGGANSRRLSLRDFLASGQNAANDENEKPELAGASDLVPARGDARSRPARFVGPDADDEGFEWWE